MAEASADDVDEETSEEAGRDTEVDVSVKQLLTGKVGSGPNSADDMTYEEARAAFERILDGEPEPETLGAFFLANRWKRNTPEELAGFLDVLRDRVETAYPETSAVDCGANYDGKTDTALLGVASGVTAAAAGTPVVVHSADRLPASEGASYRHVLQELDVDVDLDPQTSAEVVDDVGFGFYDARRFNPEVDDLLETRRATGVRTFVNTVETLVNPSNASVHLGSFYHLAFAKKICRTFELSQQSLDRVVMFQGMEGYDDVRPGYTQVAVWEDGDLRDFEIEPDSLGMEFTREDLETEDVSADSARLTREVLRGEASDTVHDAVTLNAALRLYARGDADSLEDAVDTADDSLRSGAALDRLQRLRRAPA